MMSMRNCDFNCCVEFRKGHSLLICQAQDPPCVQHSSPLTAPQRPQLIARPHAQPHVQPHVRPHALPIAHQYLRFTRVVGAKTIWDTHTDRIHAKIAKNCYEDVLGYQGVAIFWTSCSWLASFHPSCTQSCVQPPVLQRQRLSFQSSDAPSDGSRCGIHFLVSKKTEVKLALRPFQKALKCT